MSEPLEQMFSPTDTESSLQYLIYNAPYGSLKLMIDDLKALKSFNIEDEAYQLAVREHLEQHAEILRGNEDRSVVAFSKGHGTDETGSYYDNHLTKTRHYYKHQTLIASGSIPEEELHQQDVVQKLGKALETYLNEFFGPSRELCVISRNDSSVDFCYTAKTLNPSNLYNGYWLASWSFNGSKLVGRVTNRAHLYENGNCHFHEYKDFDVSIDGSDTNAKLGKIMDSIMTGEKKLAKRLSQYYQEDGADAFKGLRRALPFSLEKMNWDHSIQMVMASIKTSES